MLSTKVLTAIKYALQPLDAIATVVATALMGAIATLVFCQVVARYIFNSSIGAVVEVPKISFILVIFIAMPLAYRDGMHIGMDLISKYLSSKQQAALKRFNCIFMMITISMIIYFAFGMAMNTWDQYLSSIRFPIGAFYAGIVVGSLHLMLHILVSLITGNFNQAAAMDD